jgi:GTP-binding protein
MPNIVAIVGRPNVGKSQLFNRLTGQRHAIVDDESGVTRDRHYGKSEWNGVEFTVIDTGGYIKGSDDIFEAEIRKQVELAVEEADAIIFVTDVEEGITGLDKEVASLLRKNKKPAFLTVNKVDNTLRQNDAFEFYNLGLGEIYPISAINGSGTGELLDDLVAALPEEVVQELEESEIPRFTVVGRPNAGKSTLINALLGEERNIVTDIAGTTRDTVATRYNKFNQEFDLIDTAGIRRKTKVKEDIEFYSVMRAIRAIENSDVVFLMVDATRGFESQDQKIFDLARKNNKGIVILINKWDLVEKETNTSKMFVEHIQKEIAPFKDVPILFVSALSKLRIFKAIEEGVRVFENRKQKIKTSKLNEVMLPIIQHNPPPAYKGKYIKIKFVTQLPTHSPKFAFFANLPQYIKDPYKRFVENKLRENFDFTGVPIEIYFRKK